MTKQLLFTLIVLFGCAASVGLPSVSLAQEQSSSGSEDIENLYSQDENSPQVNANEAEPEKAPVEIKDVSDLVQLAPFSDVAVIQRRYLPKTGRFEFFIGPTAVLNDAFFNNFGLSARAAYYFQERYGIEFVGMMLTTSERQVTTDLREKRGVTTTSLVTPKSYMGLDFKWSPVYGKMTWLNRKITPFDLYFSLGGGMTGTNQGGSEPTLHLGTGQVFALSQSMAVRWDFTWNVYSAKSNVSGSGGSGNYNNLYITVGASFFFPEATYR